MRGGKRSPGGMKKKPQAVSGWRVSGYELHPSHGSTKPKKGGSTNPKGK
jgi:hypothetical protein